jgi:hypothetical protein
MYYTVVLSSTRPEVPSDSTGCSFIWPWKTPQQFQTKSTSKRDISSMSRTVCSNRQCQLTALWTLQPSAQEVGVESRDRHCRCSMRSAYQQIKTTAAWRSICQNINLNKNKSSLFSISFHFKQFYSSTPGHYPQHTTRSAFQILARCHHPPNQIDELKISSPASTKYIILYFVDRASCYDSW